MRDTQKICDDGISTDFSTRAEKLKMLLQAKNFDITGMQFNEYSMFSSTRLDQTELGSHDITPFSDSSVQSPAPMVTRQRSRSAKSVLSKSSTLTTPKTRKSFAMPSAPVKRALNKSMFEKE